jgi:hypothetical protein
MPGAAKHVFRAATRLARNYEIGSSRRQGQIREEMSEGSPSARLRAGGQKLHIRPFPGDELGQDNEVHRFED